jgi:hypothetical protein
MKFFGCYTYLFIEPMVIFPLLPQDMQVTWKDIYMLVIFLVLLLLDVEEEGIQDLGVAVKTYIYR